MSSNGYHVPDLASVLATLASLNPPNQSIPIQQSAHPAPRQQPPPLATGSQPRQPQKQVDATSIIDWSTGLRCVMKTVAANDTIVQELRRMITVQKEHEEQWWKGRQALVEKQQARKEGHKKLDAVLKLVGGKTSSEHNFPAHDEEAEELKTFDLKVYRAQHQMVKEMSIKLKSLGVPFFGTRIELVRKPGKDPVATPNQVELSNTITELELVDFQRRILVILEDLCEG